MLRSEELGNDTKKAARLWVHEVARVFSDRLVSEQDQSSLFDFLVTVSRDKLREDLNFALTPYAGTGEPSWALMARSIFFTDQRAGKGTLDEVLPDEKENLMKHLNKQLKSYNHNSKTQLSIVVFDYAIMHLLRICRIFRMPFGHAFLVGLGGTGRQSLAKLGAYLCDLEEVELETSRGYDEEQWRDDLKALLLQTGIAAKGTVLRLPGQKIRGDFMLDDINNLLDSGRVPNLFPIEERMAIREQLRGIAKREDRLDLYENGTPEDFDEYFTQRAKDKLHVTITASPVGSALRDRIRSFPSLINCCTIDWYMRWPNAALEAVCEAILVDADLVALERRQVSKACRTLH